MQLHHPQLHASIPKLSDFIFRFLKRERGGCLVIYGVNGCGKTTIARAVERIFEETRMHIGPVLRENPETGEQDCMIPNCEFVHWPRAVKGIHNEQWLVFDYASSEYLTILDDIGAEHDPSGFGLEQLYQILNRREFRHTLITTNYGPDKWDAKFERRIASRLMRNTTLIDLSQVPDYNA